MDDLLDRIAAGPATQEVEQLRVYADQLILDGEPHGELIVVATDRLGKDTPELRRREELLVAEHDAAIIKRLARPMSTRLTWRRGFIDCVAFDHHGEEPLERALAKLAAEPTARLLRRIVLESVQFDGHGDLAPVFAELARLAPRFPRLTDIVVREGANFGNPWIDGAIPIRDITPIYAAYPKLEVIELDGDDVVLGDIVMPSLRRFVATNLRSEDARRIVAAQWPSLVELELRFRHRVEHVAATFGPLLHRRIPTLEGLSLVMPTPEATQWLVRELPGAPIARDLKRLSFGRTALDEAGVRALIDRASQLRTLERLEVLDRPLSAGLTKQLFETFGRRLVLI